MILAAIYGGGLCFQERRNTLHGCLIPFHNPLFAQFSALWGADNCMEAFNPEWYQHLSISFCFENGSVERSRQNLHEKVENDTQGHPHSLLRLCGVFVFYCLHILSISYFRKVLRAYWTPVFNLLLAPSLHQ